MSHLMSSKRNAFHAVSDAAFALARTGEAAL
jgi:hypothetical protein